MLSDHLVDQLLQKHDDRVLLWLHSKTTCNTSLQKRGWDDSARYGGCISVLDALSVGGDKSDERHVGRRGRTPRHSEGIPSFRALCVNKVEQHGRALLQRRICNHREFQPGRHGCLDCSCVIVVGSHTDNLVDGCHASVGGDVGEGRDIALRSQHFVSGVQEIVDERVEVDGVWVDKACPANFSVIVVEHFDLWRETNGFGSLCPGDSNDGTIAGRLKVLGDGDVGRVIFSHTLVFFFLYNMFATKISTPAVCVEETRCCLGRLVKATIRKSTG